MTSTQVSWLRAFDRPILSLSADAGLLRSHVPIQLQPRAAAVTKKASDAIITLLSTNDGCSRLRFHAGDKIIDLVRPGDRNELHVLPTSGAADSGSACPFNITSGGGGVPDDPTAASLELQPNANAATASGGRAIVSFEDANGAGSVVLVSDGNTLSIVGGDLVYNGMGVGACS